MIDTAAVLRVGSLTGSKGFTIIGDENSDEFGFNVDSLGDINNDGIDDIVIGSRRRLAGDERRAYVIFGKDAPFATTIDVLALNGNDGFQITGVGSTDRLGEAVSGAGDVNGDGINDVIVGAPRAGSGGEAYIIYGNGGAFAANIDVTVLDGTNGSRLPAIGVSDAMGGSVGSAGDVNGDGIDDLIVGALAGDPDSKIGAGETYVVFGKVGGFGGSFDVSTLSGPDGFRIDDAAVYDFSGRSSSGAGDVNGDGFDNAIQAVINKAN